MENRDWMILKILYQEKNITKTAEELYISQPAITKRLQQIEKEFGVEIVHRGKRGVHFTPQGEYLAKFADRILAMLQEVTDNISNMNDRMEGTLRIGASYFITRHKLPNLLAQFKEKYPKVEFKVTTGWSGDVFRMLYQQGIHVAMIRGDYQWQDQQHLLVKEKLCVVSACPINLKDLPKLQRIDYKMDYKLKELINNWWWENFSEPPQVCMEVDKSDTCREMVLRGLGYAILPSMVLNQTQNLFVIEATFKDGTPITRDTWMLYQEELMSLHLVKTFVEFIKKLDFNAL